MATIDTSVYDNLGLTRPKTKAVKDNSNLGQEDFLKLMVTQLNQQDPMKPMENGEFITQIAQFSQVSGIKDLQDSFSGFAASMTSSQALQASSMVGRSVMVESKEGYLANGLPIQGKVELPVSTSQLMISITDSSGQLVRKVNVGAQSKGEFAFQWDGTNEKGDKLADGKYFVKAEMLDNGNTVELDTSIVADVQSVTLNGPGQGVLLNLAGLGQMSLSSVKEIL